MFRERKLLVDSPYYCLKCGAQYYVTGGNVYIEAERKYRKVYQLELKDGSTITSNSLSCPSCQSKLLPLVELEAVFGAELRSF